MEMYIAPVTIYSMFCFRSAESKSEEEHPTCTGHAPCAISLLPTCVFVYTHRSCPFLQGQISGRNVLTLKNDRHRWRVFNSGKNHENYHHKL